MMGKQRTHDQAWLIDNALFGCCNIYCASETSYPANFLHISPNGEPICENCWHEETTDNIPRWNELKIFNPFGEAP
jgi:hypothetical protein